MQTLQYSYPFRSGHISVCSESFIGVSFHKMMIHRCLYSIRKPIIRFDIRKDSTVSHFIQIFCLNQQLDNFRSCYKRIRAECVVGISSYNIFLPQILNTVFCPMVLDISEREPAFVRYFSNQSVIPEFVAPDLLYLVYPLIHSKYPVSDGYHPFGI